MDSDKKAQLHLVIMGACLWVADSLPTWYKPWFVAETGHYTTSSFITILLVIALFRRWRHAVSLMVAYQALHFGVIYFAVSHHLATDGPVFGYFLTGALRLAVLGIIFFSPDIYRYIRRPTSIAS